jgi:hypothetical protein
MNKDKEMMMENIKYFFIDIDLRYEI